MGAWVHHRVLLGSVLLIFLAFCVVIFPLFVFASCTQCCQCLWITHSWLPHRFSPRLRPVYQMLPVSLNYPFLIAPSLFSSLYLAIHFFYFLLLAYKCTSWTLFLKRVMCTKLYIYVFIRNAWDLSLTYHHCDTNNCFFMTTHYYCWYQHYYEKIPKVKSDKVIRRSTGNTMVKMKRTKCQTLIYTEGMQRFGLYHIKSYNCNIGDFLVVIMLLLCHKWTDSKGSSKCVSSNSLPIKHIVSPWWYIQLTTSVV